MRRKETTFKETTFTCHTEINQAQLHTDKILTVALQLVPHLSMLYYSEPFKLKKHGKCLSLDIYS